MRQAIAAFALVLACTSSSAQTADTIPIVLETTRPERVAYFKKVQNEYINQTLSGPLNKATEKDWIGSFHAMESLMYKSAFASTKLHDAFQGIDDRTRNFQVSLIELVYTLYPAEFHPEIKKFLASAPDPILFSMCIEYLLLDKKNKPETFMAMLDERMLSEPYQPVYLMLKQRLGDPVGEVPAAEELLKYDYGKNTLVLFSVQRRNRDFPGLMILRKPDGKFLRNADNSLFYVPQLSRSLSGLPDYLPVGNTPQGIYRINGINPSTDENAGPTPSIGLVLPFESKVTQYNPRIKDTSTRWNIIFYRSLLPPGWKTYQPAYAAYYAGMAGRKNLSITGTIQNPSNFKGRSWYPLAPSRGSLTTKEFWDEKTGVRTESDQYKLITAMRKTGASSGYCILFEIDDQTQPVKINEVEGMVNRFEKIN